jgi:hypothetical protein
MRYNKKALIYLLISIICFILDGLFFFLVLIGSVEQLAGSPDCKSGIVRSCRFESYHSQCGSEVMVA